MGSRVKCEKEVGQDGHVLMSRWYHYDEAGRVVRCEHFDGEGRPWTSTTWMYGEAETPILSFVQKPPVGDLVHTTFWEVDTQGRQVRSVVLDSRGCQLVTKAFEWAAVNEVKVRIVGQGGSALVACGLRDGAVSTVRVLEPFPVDDGGSVFEGLDTETDELGPVRQVMTFRPGSKGALARRVLRYTRDASGLIARWTVMDAPSGKVTTTVVEWERGEGRNPYRGWSVNELL